MTEAVEELPTATVAGFSPVVTDAELDGAVGVADGAATVEMGVFVGFGTLVFVGAGGFVAVGAAAGLLAGSPENVSALISWMLVNPSPSESMFSIAPKAAVFLPLFLYAAPYGFKLGILAVWHNVQLFRLLAAMFGYLDVALLRSPGNARPGCGSEEATMTASRMTAPETIIMIRLSPLDRKSVV